MEKVHRLLQRQMKRYLGNVDSRSKEWEMLLEVVNKAYWDSDTDREMLERSLDISSQELIQANATMQAVIDAFPDVFLRLDREGTVVSFRKGKTGEAGFWHTLPTSRRFYELFGEGNQSKLYTTFSKVLETDDLTGIEFHTDEDGAQQHFEARLVPISHNDIIAIIRDITERKLAEEQLIYFSMFDPLTNLYNRAYFEKEMHRLQVESHSPVGLIICDVDNLKLVNDTYGHDCGDRLLIEIGRLLRMSLRKNDVIARIGGDEFAVLLPGSDLEAVECTCERIRSEVTRHNSTSPILPLSVSMGYSIRNSEHIRMDEIFKEADDNMYKEKFIHHHRLSQHLIQSVLDSDRSRRFALRGRVEHIEGERGGLKIQITGSEEERGDHGMMVHLKEEVGAEAGSEWVVDMSQSEFGGSRTDFRSYLKSLIILLNLALDSIPPDC